MIPAYNTPIKGLTLNGAQIIEDEFYEEDEELEEYRMVMKNLSAFQSQQCKRT